MSRFLSEGLFIAPQMRRARGRMVHARVQRRVPGSGGRRSAAGSGVHRGERQQQLSVSAAGVKGCEDAVRVGARPPCCAAAAAAAMKNGNREGPKTAGGPRVKRSSGPCGHTHHFHHSSGVGWDTWTWSPALSPTKHT